jgi:hypothetical protein
MLISAKFPEYGRNPMEYFRDVVHEHLPLGSYMHAKQIELLEMLSQALLDMSRGDMAAWRRFLVEATKGFAKTLLIGLCISWLLIFSPIPLLIVIVARDLEQAREYIKVSEQLNRENPLLVPFHEVQQNKVLNPDSGSVAECRTKDSLGGHGSRPHLTWIDEYSHLDDWTVAETALDNAVKRPNGVVILSGNAGFIDTPAWKLRETYRQMPGCKFFQYARPVPWQNEQDLKEAEGRDSYTRFRRLFWGEWSPGTGSVAVESADLEASMLQPVHAHAPPPGEMSGRERGWAWAGGLDLSWRNDRSAFCAVGLNFTTNRLRLAHCRSWKPSPGNDVDLQEVENHVLSMSRKFGLSCVRFDPAQAVHLAQRLTAKGVNMVETPFTGITLHELATVLMTTFRERRIDLFDEPELLADLRRLQIVESDFSRLKLQATKDDRGHQDLGVSFCLALLGAKTMLRRSNEPIVLPGLGLGPGNFSGGKQFGSHTGHSMYGHSGMGFGDLQIPRGPTPTYRDYPGFPKP